MSIPYFDCHCDTIVEASLSNEGLLRNKRHIDIERISRYSPCAQVFAVCTEYRPETLGNTQHFIGKLRQEIDKNSDKISLCLSKEDIDTAIASGKIAALLSIEGASQISSLKTAYEHGVRIVHPTWNNDNYICGAAAGSGYGLTDRGREFVRSCNDMGILLDMSHASERSFWDVIELSEKPIIAGHSNSKALCDVPRNITDEQFIALTNCGGGAGINLYTGFLGLNRDFDAVIAHIEHFLSIGGMKSVFLGCDFDGTDSLPQGISGVQDMEKLYDMLLRRNYPEDLVRDIFWNNLYNIIGRVL
ncbi:MAG: membrane dipeptidase [Bacillota bacterium]|nr:membrane dipeptidase [Bacillota bacterium]